MKKENAKLRSGRENKCPVPAKNPERFFFPPNFYGFESPGNRNIVSNKTQVFISLFKSYSFQLPRPQPPAAFLTWSSRVSFSSSLKLTKIAPLVNTIMEVKHTRAQLASNSWSVYFSRRCLGLQLTASHCPTLTAERKSRRGWESFYILSSEELPS